VAVGGEGVVKEGGVAARVVSVPSFELFLAQGDDKRRAVIGTAKVKLAVEAAVRQGWDAIIGPDGVFVGMTSFGASAPYKDLYKQFGITADQVAAAAVDKMGKTLKSPWRGYLKHVLSDECAAARRIAAWERRSRECQFVSLSTGSDASAATYCARSPKRTARTSRWWQSMTSRRSRPMPICCASTAYTAAFPAR